MGYNRQNLIKDFFKRTLSNLELYKADRRLFPDKYEHEVTLTINSLLGLLVFTKEKKLLSGVNQMNIDNIINKAQYGNKKNEKTNEDFFRHMRNSIAHGRCLDDFETDGDGQIKSLRFLDFDKDSRTFEVVLTIDDINLIIDKLKEIVLPD